ncbi:hypothetical protein [Sulfobacillus thermosulfidooxidans]|uniref:hypothetical protein n=1 Tax=Sulfobacillus thermosulfidooxidans TaxID=28034 RepID=UPI0003FC1738|nr:hypothetical protein [Sulfobacillus thermosulfidooxidans]
MRWCNIGLIVFGAVIGFDVLAMDPLHLLSYVILGLVISAAITVLSIMAIMDKKPLMSRSLWRAALGALWMVSPLYIGFVRSPSMTIVTVMAGIDVISVAVWQSLRLSHHRKQDFTENAA